jgi:hypothetical protein
LARNRGKRGADGSRIALLRSGPPLLAIHAVRSCNGDEGRIEQSWLTLR